MAYTTSTSSPPPPSSGYRIKLRRTEFMALLEQSGTKRVYRVSKFMYFAYDGFVIYTSECNVDDVQPYAQVIHAIEFSNVSWQKT